MTGSAPQAALIDRLTEEEVLDDLGPSWSKMSASERKAYGDIPAPVAVHPDAGVAYPALTLWREELRRGYRRQRADSPATWRYDGLWRAACWEATAQQAARDGLAEMWHHAMARAREILSDAVAARRSA